MGTATKLQLEDFHREWTILKDKSNRVQRNLISHAYFEYVLKMRKLDIENLLSNGLFPWIRQKYIRNAQLTATKKGGITTALFWDRVKIVDYPIKVAKVIWLSEDKGIEAVHEFLSILSQKARYPEILRDIGKVLQK